MKKQTFRFPVKQVVLTVLILLGVGLIAASIWNALMTSEYFKVREVIASEGNANALSYFKGKNIFSIDLEREAWAISQVNPDCRKVVLVRNLPDRIIVHFNRRKPVALIKLYKEFVIDDEGVLLNVQGSPEEANLPMIVGLETKIFGAKAGKRYTSPELTLAQNIIGELKSNKFLKSYKIRRIDVTNLQNASFFIPFLASSADKVQPQRGSPKAIDGLEVKIDPDNIKNKIMMLAGIFLQSKNDIINIKYVDLRFKDPVIKLRDAK
ncbi:MAG: hypothetical protein NTZ92_07725 [Candidatus Omnitrophica bacterium]|nr:hypothetical protein [Candidatus Omnitrophota bacterium]